MIKSIKSLNKTYWITGNNYLRLIAIVDEGSDTTFHIQERTNHGSWITIQEINNASKTYALEQFKYVTDARDKAMNTPVNIKIKPSFLNTIIQLMYDSGQIYIARELELILEKGEVEKTTQDVNKLIEETIQFLQSKVK